MLEMGLFWFGAALIAVTLLMLFIHAFRQNKVWGIAGLVLLAPLLIHIFIAWDALSVRKATYGLVIGVLTVLVSIAGGALAHLPFLPKHEVVQTLEETIAPPKDTPLPNEEEAQAVAPTKDENYDPLLSGSEFEEVEIEKNVPPSTPPVNLTPPPKFVPIQLSELATVINKQIRLKMTSGETIDGTLTHLDDQAATVESAVEGGSLGLSYKLDEIISASVRLAAGEQLPALKSETPTEQDALALEPAVDNIPAELEQVQQKLEQINETVKPASSSEPEGETLMEKSKVPEETGVEIKQEVDVSAKP